MSILAITGPIFFLLSLRGMERDIVGIVVGKLLLHPLAVTLGFMCVPHVDPVLTAATTISCVSLGIFLRLSGAV